MIYIERYNKHEKFHTLNQHQLLDMYNEHSNTLVKQCATT
jgi:hypothetical protein